MSTIDPDADVPSLQAPLRLSISIMGPIYTGWVVELFLSGLVVAAFYGHVKRGHLKKDPLVIKSVAIGSFVLNSCVAVMCGFSVVKWGTSQARDTASLWSQDVVDCLLPAFAGATAFLTQFYFCRRSAHLFRSPVRKWIFASVVGTCMVLGFAGSLAITYYNFLQAAGINAWRIANLIWLWASCCVDIMNTGTLYYLLRTKVVGFNQRTDNVLNGIIKLAVETAGYTTFIALTAAIVLVVLDPNSYYVGDIVFAFWIPLPALYALSLFTTLGSRDRIAKNLSGPPITNTGTDFQYVSRSHFDSPPAKTRSSFIPLTTTQNRISLPPTARLQRSPPVPPMNNNFSTTSFINVCVDVAVAEDRLSDEEEEGWRAPAHSRTKLYQLERGGYDA